MWMLLLCVLSSCCSKLPLYRVRIENHMLLRLALHGAGQAVCHALYVRVRPRYRLLTRTDTCCRMNTKQLLDCNGGTLSLKATRPLAHAQLAANSASLRQVQVQDTHLRICLSKETSQT